MFIIDDLLMAPLNGFMMIVREIHSAANDDLSKQAEALTQELGALYGRLERGEIDEDACDLMEAELLDRLERLQQIVRGETPADDDTPTPEHDAAEPGRDDIAHARAPGPEPHA